MKRPRKLVAALALSLGAGFAGADGGRPWKDHAAPFDFLFGNDFDTHQQTRLDPQGGLAGFLYVTYTGAVSSDGFRVATHHNCNEHPCTVGWGLLGKPAGELATFVYHVEHDHPTFLVDRADIPQPGAYSHFHFLGEHPMTPGETKDGYYLQLAAVSTFCFVHHEAGAFNAALTCEDDANNGIIIRPGTDIATHVNIVGSYLGYLVP